MWDVDKAGGDICRDTACFTPYVQVQAPSKVLVHMPQFKRSSRKCIAVGSKLKKTACL